MLKSCNSDCIEFVCLTNENIVSYLDTIPTKVEEITFWNYQMCLDPSHLPQKEILVLPSLEKFTHLKCVKFYNERIDLHEGTFPPTVERVFFICCVLKHQWLNVCVHRKNLKHLDQYCSKLVHLNPLLPFLQQPYLLRVQSPSPIRTRTPTPPAIRRRQPPPTRRTFWTRLMETLLVPWRFAYQSSCQMKISPERERDRERNTPDGIEMSNFVTLYQPNVIEVPIQPTPSTHTLESINRFKRIYDILVTENIIQFLIGDD